MHCDHCGDEGWTVADDGMATPCRECTVGAILAGYDYSTERELITRADALRAAVIADIEAGAVAVSL